ncbi:MAG: NAD+ synthase [Candidatus Hecatellaceae archaeon]
MRLSIGILKIDPAKTLKKLVRLTSSLIEASKASGVVVGMSGGLDSSTVASLMVKALGASRVYGVAMPEQGVSGLEDVEDAKNLAERLGIRFYEAEISEIVSAFEKAIPVFDRGETLAWGNLKPRIRMTILYYFANRFNLMVAGAGNKSELLTGYFTKYGDGAADFLPLGGLYKTQVKQLAAYLGVPRKILDKTPTAGLWPGQTDEGELGLKYEVLDLILHGLVDLGLSPREVAVELGVSLETVEQVKRRVELSMHKRVSAPVLQPF